MRLLLLALCLVLTGCQTSPQPEAPRPATPTRQSTDKLVDDHAGKDAAVLREADAIDALAPAARPHTDAQRAAVAAAPAAQIEDMVRAFNTAVAALEARAAAADKTIAKQAAQIAALQDAELRAQVRTMRWFGFGCLLAAAALGYARQIGFAAVAAGLGVLSLGSAQLWASVASHPLFKPVLGGSLVLGLAGLAWAAWHAYKKGDLAAKTLREKERLAETLKVIVPALDEAKRDMGEAFQPLLGKFSSAMDRDAKQVVKRIRAEVAAT